LAQTCTVGNYAGGSRSSSFSGDDGPATSANFYLVSGGLWVDSSKTLFLADSYNLRIRKVDPNTKIVTTIAGDFDRSWTWFSSFVSLFTLFLLFQELLHQEKLFVLVLAVWLV
jgi:hypothetical protein